MQKPSKQITDNFFQKYNLYSDMQFKICMLYLGNKQDAEEAVQESFLKLIYLYYFEDYSVKHISEVLKITESAVKMRLKRGRELLKIELEGEEL